jgi:hypothetical protein
MLTRRAVTAAALHIPFSLHHKFAENSMRLYAHPVSTVCRPIRLFCTENAIDFDEVTLDLTTGVRQGLWQRIKAHPTNGGWGSQVLRPGAGWEWLGCSKPAFRKELKNRRDLARNGPSPPMAIGRRIANCHRIPRMVIAFLV